MDLQEKAESKLGSGEETAKAGSRKTEAAGRRSQDEGPENCFPFLQKMKFKTSRTMCSGHLEKVTERQGIN